MADLMTGKCLLITGVAVLLLIGSPRNAHACGQGGSYGALYTVLAAAAVVVTVDSGLLLWDAGSGIAQHHPSTGYGVFEIVWSAPQLALGAYGLTQYSGGSNAGLALYTAGMGLLLAHGIWTVSTQPRPDAADITALQVVPPLDRRRRLALGIGPTYAPVGQLARPGFGVVARF